MQKIFHKKRFLFGMSILLLVLIYNVSYADISLEELKKEYANEQSEFVEVNGMQVHYRDEGTGFPIVLMHGTAASLHTYDAWTKQLSKDYRVIRLDLPAFLAELINLPSNLKKSVFFFFFQNFHDFRNLAVQSRK